MLGHLPSLDLHTHHVVRDGVDDVAVAHLALAAPRLGNLEIGDVLGDPST
jgi:hypothetical protein